MTTGEGVSADPLSFGPWRSHWIWASPRWDLPADSERWLCFRRSFSVPEPDAGSSGLRVTADSRYVLWVNGSEASRGPVRSQPNRLRYDTVDLTGLVHPGENVFAVTVRFYGWATPWWMPAPRTYSLGGGCLLLEAKVGAEWVTTDDSWRVLDCNAWTPQRPRGIGTSLSEVHDARLLDGDWRAVGFDDSTWQAASVLDGTHVGHDGRAHPPNSPFGALLHRQVPALVGDERVGRIVATSTLTSAHVDDDPVDQVKADEAEADHDDPGGDGAAAAEVVMLTVDLGEIAAGTARLVTDLPAGTRLDVSFAEALTVEGRLRRLGQRAGFRYITRGHDDTFETFDPLGARYGRVAIRLPNEDDGDRDGLSVVNGSTVRISLRERIRPRPTGPAFSCSDDALTAIYEIGRRTVDLCAQDAYIDCPTREQRAWTGDAVVHQQVDLATNPDWALARHHPVLAASPRNDGMLPMVATGNFEANQGNYLSDWPLHWVRSLHNLMRWTGDAELVGSLLATAENLLRWFLPFHGPDGLLADVTGWVLIDWSDVQVRGRSAALNALWARGLADFAEMASWLGDQGRAAWAERLHGTVVEGFEQFWDGARGLYADHIIDGRQQPAVSQHSNAAAIVGGVAPVERFGAILDAIVDRSRLVRHSSFMEAIEAEDQATMGTVLLKGLPAPTWDTESKILAAQPFFRYVVHDAVALAGAADRLPELYRDWTVFLDAGETSWPESWHGGTHCHGWSSTPTRDLVVYTLGISPGSPGFGHVRVAPRLGDLAWAKGAAPTPYGLVEVAADRARVEITSPVPVLVDLGDGRPSPELLPAGHHAVDR